MAWLLLILNPFTQIVLVVVGIFLGRLIWGHATEKTALKGDYRWRGRWTAARFVRHFETFLRLHGWRVLSTQAVGPDRLEAVAQRDRHLVAFLYVKPGQPAVAADIARLETVRQEVSASRLALVSQTNPLLTSRGLTSPGATSKARVRLLRVEDFTNLDDVLELAG